MLISNNPKSIFLQVQPAHCRKPIPTQILTKLSIKIQILNFFKGILYHDMYMVSRAMIYMSMKEGGHTGPSRT